MCPIKNVEFLFNTVYFLSALLSGDSLSSSLMNGFPSHKPMVYLQKAKPVGKIGHWLFEDRKVHPPSHLIPKTFSYDLMGLLSWPF